MNDNELKPIDNLTYVLNLIKFLPQALTYRVADRSNLQRQLAELDGRTCTGHTHWRDKDKPGKTAKLYVLHSTNQTCPVHGKPKPDGRLRWYVGNKPDKISEALAAIEREVLRLDLNRKLGDIEGKIGYVMYRLQGLYRHLDYLPPDQREQRPAVPKENNVMATE